MSKKRQLIESLSNNERFVLDAIWRHGPISRKALAEVTGLTGASTSRLTKRALEIGLIEESLARSGTVGSPSRPLQRVTTGAYSIGVSLSKNTINCAVADLAGYLHEVQHIDVDEVSVDSIAAALDSLLGSNGAVKRPKSILLGVGIAVPGYRALENGQWAVHWDFPKLLGHDIANELSRKIGLPVIAERDAIAALWAERLNGTARKLKDFCLLYLGPGVGGAVMSDGRLLSGRHGNAGGLGALFPYDQARPTSDNLEQFLKETGLDTSIVDGTLDEYPDAIAQWTQSVTPSLVHGLEYITRLYDPQTIILSGALPRALLKQLLASSKISEHVPKYTADLPIPSLAITEMDDEHRLLASATVLPIADILAGQPVET